MIAATMPHEHASNFKPSNAFPAGTVTKAQAELDNLATLLEKEGIRVYGPKHIDWLKAGGYTGAMPQDALMAVGNSVIESPFAWRCRSHGFQLGYADILDELASDNGPGRICRAPLILGDDTIYSGFLDLKSLKRPNRSTALSKARLGP